MNNFINMLTRWGEGHYKANKEYYDSRFWYLLDVKDAPKSK
jgi:hypothetical protein